LNPIRLSTQYTSVETLRARYTELLRLREYVEQLERSLHDTAERQAIVERYEFANGRRPKPVTRPARSRRHPQYPTGGIVSFLHVGFQKSKAPDRSEARDRPRFIRPAAP